jgi:hypothetical protein
LFSLDYIDFRRNLGMMRLDFRYALKKEGTELFLNPFLVLCSFSSLWTMLVDCSHSHIALEVFLL